MDNKDFISVKEAATELGCSEQYVRKLIRSHRLAARKVGRSWIIPYDSLDALHRKDEIPSTLVPDKTRANGKKAKINALSFFTGAMGMDLGLEASGIHVILASEIDKACRETISHNRPDIALIGDIRDYSAAEIKKAAGLKTRDQIDLMVGGPPCQAFSTAGTRKGFEDDRGNVFLTFIDRIIELKPRYAVIENVRGILSSPLQHRPHSRRGFGYPPLTPDEEKGGALLHIISKLRTAGYGVTFNLYNSANFGAPQKRERVIIVCCRDGSEMPFLTPTHSETSMFGLPKWKTVREAFKGLPKKGHDHVNFPEKRLRYYRQLKAGQYWKDLPKRLHKKALGASYYAGGGKTGFLRRLPWDAPSPTLVTHPAMPATDLAHPIEDRPLSVQEYKRIQEFPDDWYIAGSIINQYRQIGNAVPASLGKAVGDLILKHMKRRRIHVIPDFPYSRYKMTEHFSWEAQVMERIDSKVATSAQLNLFAG